MLSAYFKPNESDVIRKGQLAWWCDELEDWTREQVVFGLREWNRKHSRLRPTPGDILDILKAARGRKEAARLKAARQAQPDPERERCAPDAANEIVAGAGFPIKRFGR